MIGCQSPFDLPPFPVWTFWGFTYTQHVHHIYLGLKSIRIFLYDTHQPCLEVEEQVRGGFRKILKTDRSQQKHHLEVPKVKRNALCVFNLAPKQICIYYLLCGEGTFYSKGLGSDSAFLLPTEWIRPVTEAFWLFPSSWETRILMPSTLGTCGLKEIHKGPTMATTIGEALSRWVLLHYQCSVIIITDKLTHDTALWVTGNSGSGQWSWGLLAVRIPDSLPEGLFWTLQGRSEGPGS